MTTDRIRRSRRPVALALALAFFFGPAGSYVLGARPEAIENRALRPFPSLSAKWGLFDQTTAWAIDHLPLRGDAVRANVSLSEQVFGEPPSYGGGDTPAGVPQPPGAGPQQADDESDKVLQGTDGWLYYGPDMSAKCEPTMSVPETLRRLNRLAAAVTASGRRFVFTIAPDKSTIWPRNLPEDYADEDCAAARRAEFWSALRADPPAGYVDLRGPIERYQQVTGQPAYRRTDSHWGEYGSAIYAKAVAERIQPAAFARTALHPVQVGDVTREGDLGRVLGQPTDDTFPEYRLAVHPAGTRATGTSDAPGSAGMLLPVDDDVPDLSDEPAEIRHGPAASGAPLVRPRTLIIGDSYTEAARTFIAPLMADLTILHSRTPERDVSTTVGAILDADAVVYQIVERSISGGHDGLLTDDALTAVERALRGNPR